jgi:hypothetical protein
VRRSCMKGLAGKHAKVTSERSIGVVHRVYLYSGRAAHDDAHASGRGIAGPWAARHRSADQSRYIEAQILWRGPATSAYARGS